MQRIDSSYQVIAVKPSIIVIWALSTAVIVSILH